jgi:hypothetical protein
MEHDGLTVFRKNVFGSTGTSQVAGIVVIRSG